MTLHEQLLGVVKAIAPDRPTGHKVSKLIQAKLDLNHAGRRKAQRWWERRIANEGMTPYEDMEMYLSALDYEIQIVKKNDQ